MQLADYNMAVRLRIAGEAYADTSIDSLRATVGNPKHGCFLHDVREKRVISLPTIGTR